MPTLITGCLHILQMMTALIILITFPMSLLLLPHDLLMRVSYWQTHFDIEDESYLTIKRSVCRIE